MKHIKNHDQFINEEINWKKGLATAALASSLAVGAPSCNYEDQVKPKIESSTDFIEYHKLDGRLINFIEANYSNWEKFLASKSNKTPNGSRRYTEEDYFLKKIKEKFLEVYPRGTIDTNAKCQLYYQYYKKYIKSYPYEYF